MCMRISVCYGRATQGVLVENCLIYMATDRRKISFPADSVLTSIVQDGEAYELLKLVEPPGVNINQPNHVGLTALHHGVLTNNLDAVKILLCYGADTNAQDVYGFSPLHTAAACGFLHITSLLIVFGADVLLQTKDAEMPIDVAKDIEIVRLLTEVMYPKLHQELYYSSLVRMKFWDFYRTVKCLMEWSIRTCYSVIQNLRQGQQHKQLPVVHVVNGEHVSDTMVKNEPEMVENNTHQHRE